MADKIKEAGATATPIFLIVISVLLGLVFSNTQTSNSKLSHMSYQMGEFSSQLAAIQQISHKQASQLNDQHAKLSSLSSRVDRLEVSDHDMESTLQRVSSRLDHNDTRIDQLRHDIDTAASAPKQGAH